MSKPTQILILGDFHTGSKISLCPAEGVTLDDGDVYQPSEIQKILWQFWSKDFLPWVRRAALGHRLILEDGGDGIDGAMHHQSAQTFGTNADAEELHIQLLTPLLNMADEVIYIRGSRAHVGMNSESDERIAQKMGTKAEWHYNKEIAGKLVDIRHHASASRQAWTRGASMFRMLKNVRMAAQEDGQRPPNLVIRHHVHLFDAMTDWRVDMTGISAPCWKMSDEYGFSLPIDTYDVGGVLYAFDTGTVLNRRFQP